MFQFESWRVSIKPKNILPQTDNCSYCLGTGLISSENFPEVNYEYPNVAIIGWGIWWIALAVACLHRWIPYTLYERDESFNARPQWYWLTLQQASKAIEWLGISKLEDWVTSTKHVVHDSTGKIIWEWWVRKFLDLESKNSTKRRNIHISRQWLRAELLNILPKNEKVLWGKCLTHISLNSLWTNELEFSKSQERFTSQPDLIVWADGIRSRVRDYLIWEQESPLKYLGCIVILWICSLKSLREFQSDLLDSETVFQTVNGHERIYVMPFDSENIMWQLSFPIDERSAKNLSKKGADALKKEAIRRLWAWHSPIPELLNETSISLISWYPVYDREPLEPEELETAWNITLLWDSMHPMSPFKGQWANQAILDALDLARNITSKCSSKSRWKEYWLRKILLADYEKNIIKRSTKKVNDSAKAVKLLHSQAVMHDWEKPRWRGI